MPLAPIQSSFAKTLEIAAFAPILAALLLGSLPVLLAMGVYRKFAPHPAE